MADPTPLASRFGAAVTAARKRRSWSQEFLAERVDVSKNHVGYIERGERIPSLDVAVRIAGVLGLSLDGVFFETAKVEESRQFLEDGSALLAGLTPEMRIPILEMLKAANRVHVGEKRSSSKHGRRGAR